LPPAGKSAGNSVGSDVVIEGIALQGKHDKVMPVGGGEDRDQESDVLDTVDLGVETGDDGGLERVIIVG
jgi:hypothetical protein